MQFVPFFQLASPTLIQMDSTCKWYIASIVCSGDSVKYSALTTIHTQTSPYGSWYHRLQLLWMARQKWVSFRCVISFLQVSCHGCKAKQKNTRDTNQPASIHSLLCSSGSWDWIEMIGVSYANAEAGKKELDQEMQKHTFVTTTLVLFHKKEKHKANLSSCLRQRVQKIDLVALMLEMRVWVLFHQSDDSNLSLLLCMLHRFTGR